MNSHVKGLSFAPYIPEPQNTDIGDIHYVNPKTLSHLGRTEPPQYSYTIDTETMQVNVSFIIKVLTSSKIYTEQFEKDNPGRREHIEIHELQHYEMFKEAMSKFLELRFEGFTFTGRVDEIATSYLRQASALLQTTAAREGITQAEFDSRFTVIQENVRKLIDMAVKNLSDIYNAQYPITKTSDKQEEEAVRRTVESYKKMNKAEPTGDVIIDQITIQVT